MHVCVGWLLTKTANATWLPNHSVKVKAKDGPNKGDKVDFTLLSGVHGYALPGTLTALMGASGAGKTTLMVGLSASPVARWWLTVAPILLWVVSGCDCG